VSRRKKNSNRVKAGQKPEATEERRGEERRRRVLIMHATATKLALIKRLSHESMTLHLTIAFYALNLLLTEKENYSQAPSSA